MVKAAFEIMQKFNEVLGEYNEYRLEEWKEKHGLAAQYVYGDKKSFIPNPKNVKRHVDGEWGDDYYELVDGTCLWIAQEGYRWNRAVLDNLKDRNKVFFERVTSMNSDELMQFALTGKSA